MSNECSIKQECEVCRGTGLYSGFMEPKGVAVICRVCDGKGWHIHRYNEFTGRKKKEGIRSIIRELNNAERKAGESGTMSYEEFLLKIKE